jgi:mannose-6-phosphate isomerase-like protein (cupin superfamily)
LTIGQEVPELQSNLQEGVRPTRRVVTGTDEHGRSRVVWDGPAPNAIGAPSRPGGGMLDLWVFHQTPAPLSGEEDAGHLPYNFEPPREGAHLRIVQSAQWPADYQVPAMHEPTRRPGGTWDRGGSIVHMTETVDYGIVLEGERQLWLDDRTLLVRPGDVVVQVGNWHGWGQPTSGSRMAFVMMGGTFDA